MKRLVFRGVFVDIILWPAVIAACLLALGVDAVSVRGPSMEPVLRDGETAFVNRFAYGLQLPVGSGYTVSWDMPSPGDIVVFRHPTDGRMTVKRNALAPGTPVRFENGRLYAAGHSWRVSPEVRRQLAAGERIPEDHVFLVGTNPAASTDSRDFGVLPVSDIYGRVVTLSGIRGMIAE
ncbi:MAG: signal peptidase I [Spirochaetaceae bacterium]